MTEVDPYAPEIHRPREETMGDGRFRAPIYSSSYAEVESQLPKTLHDDEEPFRATYQQCEFTTCVAVERWPALIYDVNGYYRDLGVGWWASKRELRQAYELRGGADSPRLTYVLKQLLDDDVRRLYDAVPYGSIFFDDVVAAHVKRVMADDAAKARLAGTESLEDGQEIDLSDQIGKAFQVVDGIDGARQDGRSGRWGWGYYLHRSEVSDTSRLRAWQALLVQALAERREIVRLAVGYVGGQEEPFVVRPVGYRLVCFLHEDVEPTEELAEQAAQGVLECKR